MSVAKLTSDYKKFLGPTPTNAFSARCYASQFLHDPAKGSSHTPDDIALATNQPKELISEFCRQWLIVAKMSVDDMLNPNVWYWPDLVIELFLRQRLANETVLRDHICDIHERVMGKKTASHLLPLLKGGAASPRSDRRRGLLPSWMAESYRGETVRNLWPMRPRVCRVEVIDKVEAAFPALGSDPQWLYTKAKRATRARLTSKQHKIMEMALFSTDKNDKMWATSYMALVDYLETAP
jgi:hypothetical protein